jgi:hypothetical protein
VSETKRKNLDCRTRGMEGEGIPQCQAIHGKKQKVARQANHDQAIQAERQGTSLLTLAFIYFVMVSFIVSGKTLT